MGKNGAREPSGTRHAPPDAPDVHMKVKLRLLEKPFERNWPCCKEAIFQQSSEISVGRAVCVLWAKPELGWREKLAGAGTVSCVALIGNAER